MQTRSVIIAAAQYQVEHVGNWENYVAKVEQLIEAAVRQGGQILVLPEYASMELVSLFSDEVCASLERQLEDIQTCFQPYVELYQQLAQQHQVYILAGTFPFRLAEGHYRNRAYFFAPNGSFDYQEKLMLTSFEKERWVLEPGNTIKIFASDFGRVGISICYDSEFPLLTEKQVEAGAELILVPSCTGTLAGYNRVRISCQARAVENQCYVVQSPTVGCASWCVAMGDTAGAAAVFTPVDRGFPEDGVLALGQWNKPQWVYAEVERAALEEVREEGEVYNFQDLARQRLFSSRLVAMATL